MKNGIECQILRYLQFRPSGSKRVTELWENSKENWRRGLAFADTAGLALLWLAKLKARDDFSKVPYALQQQLEQRLQDNGCRMKAITDEFIQFNSMLQAQDIRYLNLKGLVLCPDFVERTESRVQYDHDFLILPNDLDRAYNLFLALGYSPLDSSRRPAVGHFPTLIKKTSWEWKGNLYDPSIPRTIELHFQLWEADFDLIPIRSLDDVWQNSHMASVDSLSVPVLSRVHTLLYCTLHSFRHLLRNDLRLSHLFEIAFFLNRHRQEEEFWVEFLASIARCRRSLQAVALVFELSSRVFEPVLIPMIRQFISDHLSLAGDLWIRKFGIQESVQCYRRSKNAIFLHLDFVEGSLAKSVVVWRKTIPRRLPLPSFGVQIPNEKQTRRFRALKLVHYIGQLLERAWFHVRSLACLSIQCPVWLIQLHFGRKAWASPAPCGESPLPR